MTLSIKPTVYSEAEWRRILVAVGDLSAEQELRLSEALRDIYDVYDADALEFEFVGTGIEQRKALADVKRTASELVATLKILGHFSWPARIGFEESDGFFRKLADSAAIGVEVAEWYRIDLDKRVKSFAGRQNASRKALYENVLDVWTSMLGRSLKFSRQEKISGPLIRFFLAVVKPMIGKKTPDVEGIRKIIDQKRSTLQSDAGRNQRLKRKSISKVQRQTA